MNLTITSGEIITWVIIGLLSGSAAAALLTRNRRGFGLIGNLLLGLVGAFIGGILFNLLNISILENVTVSLGDLIAGLVGAVVVVLFVRLLNFFQRRGKK